MISWAFSRLFTFFYFKIIKSTSIHTDSVIPRPEKKLMGTKKKKKKKESLKVNNDAKTSIKIKSFTDKNRLR